MQMPRRWIVVCASVALVACGGGGGGGGSSTPPPPSADTTPDAFVFASRSNATASVIVQSDAVVISGITAPAAISVTGGEYSIDGGAFTSANGTVSNGARVVVRITSNVQPGATTTATLTIGGV